MSIQFKRVSHHITKFAEFFVRKGYLKNTITNTVIIVLSRKIFKQISEVLCNRVNDVWYSSTSKEYFKHRFSYYFFFSSSTKKSYLLSVNPVLGASVAMNNRFSKFTCNNWFRSQVLTRFIFKKNLLTHAVLRGTVNIR